MAKKALLVILDGWGIGNKGQGDVISQTPTPFLDDLNAHYPHAQLLASGEHVGLPDGQMGNSEVGHLNIGAGRIVYQDLVKINRAIQDGSIRKNPEVISAFEYAKRTGRGLHLMGLTSTGGVHSELGHLEELIDIAHQYEIKNTFVHCFMDGRDTDPKSGVSYIRRLTEHCARTTGLVATIIGRFYAMDRDKRWERVKVAYDLLVEGKGRLVTDMVKAVEDCYARDTDEHKDTDEFMEPLVNSAADSRIKEGDVVIFFNYRNDRAKELTTVLTQKNMPESGMHTIPGLQFYCMTPYDASFTNVHILFPKDDVANTLGEYLSAQGLSQLHTAETEKYAHVTFFFNGGREAPFAGEERILVPSPKVATYDLQPEMSAVQVKDKLTAAISQNKYDFIVVNFANGDMAHHIAIGKVNDDEIVVNFANGDMVGHTGVYAAIEKAVMVVDACVKDVITAARQAGYASIIIADHGNADNALNADGTPNTAHSLNPVPFIYVDDDHRNATVHNGVLADVAPSVLHILGLPQPKEMTGHNLIDD